MSIPNEDLLRQPALVYVLQLLLWSQASGQPLPAASHMGIPITDSLLAYTQDTSLRSRIIEVSNATYKTWRGLDVRHLIQQQGVEYRQFDVFSALDAATPYLTQEMFDFITLRDVPKANLDCALNATQFAESAGSVQAWFGEDEDTIRLVSAFRQQMVDNAAAFRNQIAIGAYIMQREPLPRLDELLIYEQLRLLITPAGIAVSIVRETEYVPFWWTPDGINTSLVWLPASIHFAIDVLLACIWHDACVVQMATFNPQKRRGFTRRSAGGSPPPQHKSSIVRLPRIIYETQWGSPTDREQVDRISRQAHTVRGHYRLLADGREASEDAKQNASDHLYPEPPPGFTFVKPHIRGEGEPAQHSPLRVICKGLQVAKTVLS